MSAIAAASASRAARITSLRRGAGEREREGGVLVELELAATAHVDLEVGEDADRALERGAVGLLRTRHGLLDEPRRRLERLAHLRLRHALIEQRGGTVDLAQAADDRIHESPRALAVRLELLGQPERRLEVAGDQRVGEVVGLGSGVTGGERIDVRGRDAAARVHGEPQLLELAR